MFPHTEQWRDDWNKRQSTAERGRSEGPSIDSHSAACHRLRAGKRASERRLWSIVSRQIHRFKSLLSGWPPPTNASSSNPHWNSSVCCFPVRQNGEKLFLPCTHARAHTKHTGIAPLYSNVNYNILYRGEICLTSTFYRVQSEWRITAVENINGHFIVAGCYQ